jgi:hypothetical protein
METINLCMAGRLAVLGQNQKAAERSFLICAHYSGRIAAARKPGAWFV